MEKIKIIRTIQGEYFIGEVANSDGGICETDKITLNHVRKLASQMTMNGAAAVMLIPVCIPINIKPIDTIEVPKSFVLFDIDEDNVQKELIDEYKSEISGIKIVSNANGLIS